MRRWLLFLLLTITLASLIAVPAFRYRQVTVFSGESELTRTISTLVQAGDSPLFFPYFSMRRSILRAEPSLYTVRFVPVLSAGFRLEVIPEARTPVAYLENRDSVACLDDQQVVFPCGDFSSTAPRVELPQDTHFHYGEKLKDSLDAPIDQVLSSFSRLSLLEFPRLSVDSKGNWLFYTKEGMCIKIGRLSALDQKLLVLAPILRVIGTKSLRVAYIDVRVENMPVIKLAGKEKK